jgi:hypothetical protein
MPVIGQLEMKLIFFLKLLSLKTKIAECAFNQFGAKWQITSPYCLSKTCSSRHSRCLFFAEENAERVICILQFLLQQVWQRENSHINTGKIWQKILYGRVSSQTVTYLRPRTKGALECVEMIPFIKWLMIRDDYL